MKRLSMSVLATMVIGCVAPETPESISAGQGDHSPAESPTSVIASAVTCNPAVQVYPVRGPHNHGYDVNSNLWTCNADRSNSDWVPTSSSNYHVGNDIWAARGTPVASSVNGVITASGRVADPGPGWRVVIQDDCGWFHYFYHLDSIAAGMSAGVRVAAGQIIGSVGNSGSTSKGVIHLHYSIGSSGSWTPSLMIDPFPYLRAVEANVCTRRWNDIIWQHDSGQIHYWPLVNGQRVAGLNVYIPAGPEWHLRGMGDVNGDGYDDVIWQHDSGQVHYWPMARGQRLGGFNISTPVGPEWRLRGIGDINGDGTDDIVWQGDSGQVHYWTMSNGQRIAGVNLHTPVGPEWALRGVGDVNGDGYDDIVWQGNSGQVHYWQIVAGQRVAGINIHTPAGPEWHLRGVGNID